MRQPYYVKSRNAWFLKVKQDDGRLKRIKLADNETEAMQRWEAMRPETITLYPMPLPPRIVVAKRSKRAVVTVEAVEEPIDDSAGEFTDTQQTRCRQLARVLSLIECLAPLRYGATIADLTTDVSEITGDPVCERTIRRDLEALETFGLTDRCNEPGKWRFRNASPRSAMFARLAEQRSEQRDPLPLTG